MLTETDRYLICALQEGDYRAFEILFKTYYPVMCRYACSFVHTTETAEDIVSDLFVKLWEQPVILSVNSTLKGYLLRSVHNACLNYLSRTHTNFRELDRNTADRLNDLIPSFSEDDPSKLFDTAELEEQIEKAMKKLPQECGKIFTMSRKDTLSHREIAEKLNISENTVKVQIYRALIKLREALKEYF
jgi:RNA polymerase sigma-70 factor (ECF subfamily)